MLFRSAALGLVVGALLWSFIANDATSTDAPGPSPVLRSLIPLPEGKPLNQGDSIALSRDGSVLALNAGLNEQSGIYLRRLDSFEMELIPGTE